MDYKKTTLNNGLRVISVPIQGMESATVTVWVGVGSRYEKKNVQGLSHFLEHMVFKGSKKRPSAKAISEAIDAFGGEFNASTFKEWTNFYIKAPVAKIETAVDVLSDMVLNPLLREEDIEREKGVILEEMAMYEDTPVAKIEDVFENLIFEGNSLADDIVGTKDSIPKIKRDDFELYRKIYYGSNNIVITISGGIEEKKAISLVERYFAALVEKNKGKFAKFQPKQKKPKVLLKTKDIEQSHMILGFLGNRMGHEDRYAEAVLDSILGGGMSSRMFLEVREKRGLAYAVRTSVGHYLDTGSFSTYAGVDVKKAEEALKVMLDQYFGLRDKRYKIGKKEFIKAKEYLKGHLALSLEDTKAVNSFFGVKELLLNKIETPEEVYEGVDNVTVEDVYRVAKYMFKPERLNLAIIGPYKDSREFEKVVGC